MCHKLLNESPETSFVSQESKSVLVKPASLELIQLGHNRLRFSLYKLIQVSNEKYGLAIRF